MAKPIYLCSLKEHAGKSLLSIGIMQKLQKEGKKVAYFKPVGVPRAAYNQKADRDVGFILNSVFSTSLPYSMISPVSIPDSYYIDMINEKSKEEYLQTIKLAYEGMAKEFDYIVIEGAPSIKKFIRVGLDDITIAQTLGINKVIIVQKESSDKCIDNLFFTKKYFDFRKCGIEGVIFNKIDFDYIPRIEELKEEHILRYGIPLIGIVEKSLELISPRVIEVQNAIGGELINEKASAGLGNLVESYIIGAMNAQGALKYLRQVKKAAVITGGDRADLVLVALNQDVSVIILTGFIQPDVKIITAANEKGIPLLLSPSDTYTTMRNIERLRPGIQEDEIQLVLELLDKSLEWELIL